MSDLAAFLLSCIEDDEDDQREEWNSRAWHRTGCPSGNVWSDGCTCGVPDRVLADCEAKRRVVDLYRQTLETDATMRRHGSEYHSAATMERVLLLLAQPYADRPGFDEAWRVP